MQRVQIEVSRLRRYGAGATFAVFGDLGTGQVDLLKPLTAHPVALWPEAAPRSGHLGDGHLTLRHLDSVAPDGHLEAGHVETEHLAPARAITAESPLYVFGRFQHAVVMYDELGNPSPTSTAAITVNSAPTVPEGVTRAGYDEPTDRITFSFVPARFEPLRGM